jgi:hypothetical protein
MSESPFGNLNIGVFCCGHVHRQERPILLVTHETDGDWQFLCGGTDHHDPDDLFYLHLYHMLDADPTLHDVGDLHLGWEAERVDAASGWIRTKIGRADG